MDTSDLIIIAFVVRGYFDCEVIFIVDIGGHEPVEHESQFLCKSLEWKWAIERSANS